jgi:hypothetical protein
LDSGWAAYTSSLWAELLWLVLGRLRPCERTFLNGPGRSRAVLGRFLCSAVRAVWDLSVRSRFMVKAGLKVDGDLADPIPKTSPLVESHMRSPKRERVLEIGLRSLILNPAGFGPEWLRNPSTRTVFGIEIGRVWNQDKLISGPPSGSSCRPGCKGVESGRKSFGRFAPNFCLTCPTQGSSDPTQDHDNTAHRAPPA